LAAESPGSQGIRIHGVGARSIQGDIRFADAAQQMGAHVTWGDNWMQVQRGRWPLQAITLDCNAIPDAAMTLGVMALYADGPTTLTNIASWRVKETDRIDAMANELRKLGAQVETGPDHIRITPPASVADWRAGSIHTYDDHRVAMCFALAAFNPAHLPVRIEEPKCVAKTFPDFFETLFSVCQARAADIPVICIDGPTASGKGTLAAEVAARLGYHVLDSGLLYRLTALAAQRAGLPTTAEALAQPGHAERLGKLARHLPARFESGRAHLGDEEVSAALRDEAIGMAASRVSALQPVREALLLLQHSFRHLPGLVADGRDMGTVVFPDAALKVFLTASAERRAARRFSQLSQRGENVILEDLLQALLERDRQDTQRAHAPLKPAKDALSLDNSEQTIDESVAQVLGWWQSVRPFRNASNGAEIR
jgi:3-phosphoshikimate 1-carboxyvinyltransferase